MLGVFVRRVLDELFSVRVYHAHFAIVEVDVVVLVHHAHVIGVMGVDVAEDQVNVGLVAKHDVIEEFERELPELHCPLSHLQDFFALVFSDAFGQAAGDGSAWMNFASADHLDDGVTGLARRDDLAANLQPDFVNHAEDVSLRDRRVGTHDEIGTSERVEVGGMVGDVEGHVEQFTQKFGCARRVHVIDRVRGFGGGHVMRLGADAADAVGQQGHLFNRPPNAEAFEAAQFGDLEVGVGNVAFLVQEDFDLAVTFEAGDGVNCDSLCHSGLHFGNW